MPTSCHPRWNKAFILHLRRDKRKGCTMFSWQLGPKERLYYVCLTQRKRMSSKQISQEDCHKLENNFRYLACQVRMLCSVDFPQVSRILIHFFLFPCIRFFPGNLPYAFFCYFKHSFLFFMVMSALANKQPSLSSFQRDADRDQPEGRSILIVGTNKG